MQKAVTPASINCAARICCPPAPAARTKVEIACGLGLDEDAAIAFVGKMDAAGLCFMPQKLADVIAEIADHPGRHAAE